MNKQQLFEFALTPLSKEKKNMTEECPNCGYDPDEEGNFEWLAEKIRQDQEVMNAKVREKVCKILAEKQMADTPENRVHVARALYAEAEEAYKNLQDNPPQLELDGAMLKKLKSLLEGN